MLQYIHLKMRHKKRSCYSQHIFYELNHLFQCNYVSLETSTCSISLVLFLFSKCILRFFGHLHILYIYPFDIIILKTKLLYIVYYYVLDCRTSVHSILVFCRA